MIIFLHATQLQSLDEIHNNNVETQQHVKWSCKKIQPTLLLYQIWATNRRIKAHAENKKQIIN